MTADDRDHADLPALLAEALRPFATFAVREPEDGPDTDGSFLHSMLRERVIDWLGPSDFLAAREAFAALSSANPARVPRGAAGTVGAPRDGTPVLLTLRADLADVTGRDDHRRWAGTTFVGHHRGIAEGGFDPGWSVSAPVGHGGFPDGWIASWSELPDRATGLAVPVPDRGRREGVMAVLGEILARANDRRWRWHAELAELPGLEDGLSEDGETYTPLGDGAAFETGHAHGRMCEADAWIHEIEDMVRGRAGGPLPADSADAVRARLLAAFRTTCEDDMSTVGTVGRERHVERVMAMLAAADALAGPEAVARPRRVPPATAASNG